MLAPVIDFLYWWASIIAFVYLGRQRHHRLAWLNSIQSLPFSFSWWQSHVKAIPFGLTSFLEPLKAFISVGDRVSKLWAVYSKIQLQTYSYHAVIIVLPSS